MLRPLGLALLFLMLCAGCASPAPAPVRQLYLLGEPADAAAATGSTAATRPGTAAAELAVDEITLAGYLDARGIVYQSAPNRITVAARHLWAEPLTAQVRRFVAAGLQRRLQAPVHARPGAAPRGSATLSLSLDAFHGRHDGQAVAQGRWQLRSASGETLAGAEFRHLVPLEEDGYEPLVGALATALQRLVDEVAAAWRSRHG